MDVLIKINSKLVLVLSQFLSKGSISFLLTLILKYKVKFLHDGLFSYLEQNKK